MHFAFQDRFKSFEAILADNSPKMSKKCVFWCERVILTNARNEKSMSKLPKIAKFEAPISKA